MALTRKKKRIVIVGNYKWDVYEEALRSGFADTGLEVSKHVIDYWSFAQKLSHPIALLKLNESFLKDMRCLSPEVLFLYRVNEILPRTLIKLREHLPELKIILYHNDNPYVGLRSKLRYFLFLKCIRLADLTYVYRPSNIVNARHCGARNIEILLPYYYSKNYLDCSQALPSKLRDVVFIGHYEENRASYLHYLVRSGVQVEVYGPGWDSRPTKMSALDAVVRPPVYGEEYRQILASSKISLCFLSKKNKDVYTRRNFEVPAAGSLMLSEKTQALADIFDDGKEIAFFETQENLLLQVKKLLGSAETIAKITQAGRLKVIDFHSEIARANQIMGDLKKLSNES